MNRRRFLAGCLLPTSIAATGCQVNTGSAAECTGEWSPGIDGDEPTVAPGGSTTVSIDVANTVGLQLDSPATEHLEFDVPGASVIPSPDEAVDTAPPKWYWDGCTGVGVTVPVRAVDDATPGEYAYTVSAIQSRDGDGEADERRFAISIPER